MLLLEPDFIINYPQFKKKIEKAKFTYRLTN